MPMSLLEQPPAGDEPGGGGWPFGERGEPPLCEAAFHIAEEVFRTVVGDLIEFAVKEEGEEAAACAGRGVDGRPVLGDFHH